MSKRVLLFVLTSVLMPFCIFAQDYTVKGSVWDFDIAEPICSVAVSVYQITGNDTIFCGGDTTDDNGSFTIGNLKAGDYVLRTIFEHYFNAPKNFTLSPGTYIEDLGKITMRYGKGDLDPAIKAVSVKIVEPKSFFNSALYDEKASAEEVIRRNPDVWKINDNGVLEVNGKEVHQMVVNGKVVYSYKDTITDPARLLEEITRRVNANNHPVEPVVARIEDYEFLPDSVFTPYRLPVGESIEQLIRKLPGVEVHDDGSVTVDGKPILNRARKVRKNEFVMEVESVSEDDKAQSEASAYPYKLKTYKISEGTTLKDFLSQLPGVKENKDGKLITKKQKKTVSKIIFNDRTVYGEIQGFKYPEDYKLKSGTIIITIEDKKFYDEIPWLSVPDDLPEGYAQLMIRYYPGENVKQALSHIIVR